MGARVVGKSRAERAALPGFQSMTSLVHSNSPPWVGKSDRGKAQDLQPRMHTEAKSGALVAVTERGHRVLRRRYQVFPSFSPCLPDPCEQRHKGFFRA